MDAQSPTIASFVIRFVIESGSDEQPGQAHASYRGAIRHVQSEQELNFNSWADAVGFIQRFVPLDAAIYPENTTDKE